jgi:6-phosphofructokinase 1
MSNDAVETSGHLLKHHLATWQEPGDGFGLPDEEAINQVLSPLAVRWPEMQFKNTKELVMGHIIQNDSKAALRPPALKPGCMRGNACRKIWWNPAEVKAAIVTCGGLCPGLNSIIRGVTRTLSAEYGVREIYGMQAGYNGLSDPEAFPPIPLTPESVSEIHMKGGSMLKAGRGGFDAEKILDSLQKRGISMVFLVGGDGTQFAGNLLYEAALKRAQPLSIVGVPKSIDNDVVMFDRTFGFESAVAEASEVIRNAWVEASSAEKGVGIVKLMGRDAGFVAMCAALASDLVDLVMIPEAKVKLEDVLAHVDAVVAKKGHMVIAVAEGACQDFVATGKRDATGHTIYGDIGTFLRDKVNEHLKPKGGRSFYIDPSYIIRSCAVRPVDHTFCSRLAIDAVHTAMRGYTGVCVGPIHNIIVMLPSKLIASGKKKVNVHRSAWSQTVQMCGMPENLSGMAS